MGVTEPVRRDFHFKPRPLGRLPNNPLRRVRPQKTALLPGPEHRIEGACFWRSFSNRFHTDAGS